jgi:nicotinamide-nucleotide amidase
MQYIGLCIIMLPVIDPVEIRVGILLKSRGLTVGTVESATGGLIAHRLTGVAGSSDYYLGSIVSYSNDIKSRVVGVKAASIDRYGAVSATVAEQMASGGRKLLNVDICLSDTGVAGPGGGTDRKPVGLFYLGLSCKEGSFSRSHVFTGDRSINKQSAAEAALQWLEDYLTGKWSPGLS